MRERWGEGKQDAAFVGVTRALVFEPCRTTRSKRTGAPVLRYREDWAHAEEGRVLSLSLPFTASLEHRGDAVANYFDNLLPDSSAIRRRLRRRFHARSDDPFDLLTAIGRDCVGAVQLLPPDEPPQGWNRIEAEPLSERELDVLRLLGTDLSGPDIARQLMVSLNTLRTHTKNIYDKLGVNNRRAAVHRAEELKLL